MNPIFLDGKEYISAIRASKKIGYASDYIGQLCRAKKIPGRLIGKTWYVDFSSLLEHRKNRKLGRGKGVSVAPPYEESPKVEEIYQLPKLSKKSPYVEPIWNVRILRKAVTIPLALLIAISSFFSLLEDIAPLIATDTEQKINNISDVGKKFLVTLPTNLARDGQLAAVSLSDGMNEFFKNIIAGFRSLKEIALSKIFIKQLTTNNLQPTTEPKAVTGTTQTIDLASLKNELKSELENYINVQIGSARSPIVVYSSSPTLATADFDSFKNDKVVPIIYNIVTNQSDSDSDRLSSIISNLTNDGTFVRASFNTICLSSDCRTSWPSGGSGTFAWTPTSYGVSTSTTLGFLSGFLSTASSTIDSNLTITGNSTTTNATTTNFFSTTASSSKLFTATFNGAGLASCTSNNVLTWSGGLFGCEADDGASFGQALELVANGDFLSATSSALKSFVVGATTTASLDLAALFQVNATGTTGTLITASSTTGFTGNFLKFKNAAGTSLFTIDSTGSFIAANSTSTSATSTALFGSTLTANTASFGQTASTTISTAGLLTSQGFISQASSTVVGSLTVTGNSTTTNATTTQFHISSFFNFGGDVFDELVGTGLALSSGDLTVNQAFTPTWTGAHIFDNITRSTTTSATSTSLFANLFTGNSLSIGGSATTTINTSGDLLVVGSTTLQNFTFTNATGTSATSTNFFSTTASSSKLFSASFNGAGLTSCTSNNVLTWSGGLFGCEADDGASFGQALELVANGDFLSATSSALKSFVVGATTTASLNTTSLFQVNATGTTGNLISASSTTNFAGKFLTFNNAAGTELFRIDSTGALQTTASTTLQNFTALQSTTTNSTSTQFHISSFFNFGGDVFDELVGTGLALSSGDLTVNQAFTPTWTGAHIFDNITRSTTTSATSTSLFANLFTGNSLSIGGSATTTINTSGDLLVVGSTTLQNFTFTNATGTSATSTNFFSTTASSTNLFSSLLTVGGTGLVVDSNRKVGIGTTEPGDKLDVRGSVGITSSDGDGVTLDVTSNDADDTVFRIRPLGSDTVNALAINNQADSVTRHYFRGDGTVVLANGAGNVGIGTTTPTWLLNPYSATAPQLALSAGAGFAQWAFRNAGGNFYLATTTVNGTATTSLAALSIASDTGLITTGKDLIVSGNSTTTNATSTNFFSTTASTTNFYGGGLTTCQSNNVLTYDGAGRFGCEADDSGGAPDSKWATTTDTLNPNAIFPNASNNTLVGIGTSTPMYQLTVASTTGPQLSLSSGSGFSQWAMRNAGGNFYLATTTVAGTATSSLSALSIIGASGYVGIGTNAPAGNLGITANTTNNGTALDIIANLNSDSGSNDALTGINLRLNNNSDGSASGDLMYGMQIDYADVSINNAPVYFLKLLYQEPSATLADAIIIDTNNSAPITDAIDASNASIVNALNIGTNTILGTTGVIDFTNLDVTASGYLGLGTSTPQWGLQSASSTGAQLTLSDPSVLTNNHWSFRNAGGLFYLATSSASTFSTSTASVFSINANGIPTFTSLAGVGCAQFDAGGALANTGTACGSGGGTPDTKWATTTDTLNPNAIFPNSGNNNTLVGIGTSTPMHQLTVASSTGAQLALSDGAGIAQWAMRNAGGNFYFATTTVNGTATTSTSALTIIGSTGNIGIASSTPWGLFSINPDGISGPAFTIGSSTATMFSITSGVGAGSIFNYGVSATSTIKDNTKFAWTIATSSTATPIFRIDTTTGTKATSTFVGGLSVDSGAFEYDFGSGITSIDNTNLGSLNFDTDAGIVSWIDLPVATTTANVTESYTAQLDGNPLLTLYGLSDGSGGAKNLAVGIGTTTPTWLLTVASSTGSQLSLSAGAGFAQWVFRNAGGDLFFSTTTVNGTATTTTSSLEIAGGGFGTTTIRGLNIVGQATSTSNVGYNITAGCYAINGTCVGGGGSMSIGGAITSATEGSVLFAGASGVLAQDNANFFWDDTNNRLGIGSTTPWGQFSINPNLIGAGVPAFVIGSSTATLLSITPNNESTLAGAIFNYGAFATTTIKTNAKFAWTIATTTTIASSTLFRIDTTTGAEQVVIGAGYGTSAVHGSVLIGDIGAPSDLIFEESSTIHGQGANTLTFGSAGDKINFVVNTGFATATPQWLINPFSSTDPQLALSAGAGIAQWIFRNAGGNLYFATTTVAGNATTTGATGLTITGSSGNVGVGTTSPWQALSVVGGVAFNGLTAAASGNVIVCINDTTKLLYQGGSATSCEPSSARYKNNINDSEAGLDELMQLRPITFHFNDDSNDAEHVGFIAEEVFEIDPRLVQLNKDGLPDALRLGEFLPVIVKSIQELNLNLESIASTTATSTPKSQSFAASFFSSLFSKVGEWLANAGNGIQNIFTKAISTEIVYTKQLCIDDICITKTELQALLNLANLSAQAGTSPSTGSGSPPSASTTPSTSDPVPDPVPVSTSTPISTSTPTSTSTPQTTSISGCTDPTATNYDPSATSDDGSCVAPAPAPDPEPPVVSEVDSTGSPQVEPEPTPEPTPESVNLQ
ncbi:MAG: hypothetical protein A3G05_02080 [Candidatus Zambryskibacteria bacterium RIFCSPLOWO2_12_FULL_45_14]|uniref:Peptidase S74 domain-containing protein n=1 Tax=Candidatus Zambryskibacteria bacterium RIFCSPLOWO2_12_FULL_45_14 TaxID=1802778 RepID=A0A1G2UWB7_9BACT|nr:MAG: hypothetical protein A3G05_02080 [Candidatus Zambryskibacteria bacterium RIFCSPLOWO2_12_FULL_45_14]